MINNEINKEFIKRIRKLYIDAENIILQNLTNRLKNDIVANISIMQQKLALRTNLAVIKEVHRRIDNYLEDITKNAKEIFDESIVTAYLQGINSANRDFNKKLLKMADIGIPLKIQRLLLAGYDIFDKAGVKILRAEQDIYRAVMSESIEQALLGIETRVQAAQKVYTRLTQNGITGFIDRRGRNWELTSYIEMATRTTTSRAAITGHIDRQEELGNNLVIVSDHGKECPLCRPWENKVLRIAGNDTRYDTLESATAAGLLHANCKHTISAYFPGITEIPRKPVEDNRGYEITQQQRYNERKLRYWDRMYTTALTEKTQNKAEKMLKYYKNKQTKLLKGTGIRRKYEREKFAEAR